MDTTIARKRLVRRAIRIGDYVAVQLRTADAVTDKVEMVGHVRACGPYVLRVDTVDGWREWSWTSIQHVFAEVAPVVQPRPVGELPADVFAAFEQN